MGVESHNLMNISDVVITITIGCVDSFTKITVDSLTIMDSFDVSITTSVGCEGSYTKVAAEFFSP